jgi:hypothetical protein
MRDCFTFGWSLNSLTPSSWHTPAQVNQEVKICSGIDYIQQADIKPATVQNIFSNNQAMHRYIA